MLYLTTAAKKALCGKFSYGKKLRSSKSFDFNLKIPVIEDNEPDIENMELFILAIKKMVIKDIVEYSRLKIDKTCQVINKNNMK